MTEKFKLETKQVSFFFCKLGVQSLDLLTEAGVIKHGTDLGGLLGFSCADLQVSPISIGGPPVQATKVLHEATHDGFCWMEDGMHGGGGGPANFLVMTMMAHLLRSSSVSMVVAEPEPVEVILHSSTINQAGHIC